MVKDYIDTNDFTKEELLGMVDLLSLIHIFLASHVGSRKYAVR